jgi:hypothetical protein
MKGLYSGRVIMARKAAKGSLTRTQTAAQAYASIIKKYGSISDTAKYMHKGTGNWVKYSIENDRKRTGKVTTDIKKWRAAPHKLDFAGKDTKEAKKAKRTFSVAALKAPAKMAGRGKKPIVKHDTVTKRAAKQITKSAFNIPTDIDEKLRKDAFNLIVNSKDGDDFKKRMVERGIRPKKDIKEKALRKDRLIGIITQRAEELITPKINVDNYNMGEISTIRAKLRPIEHEISKAYAEKAIGSAWNDFKLSSLKQSGKPTGRKTKELPKVERTAITKTIPKKIQPKPVRTRYIYGSFQRPIWNGFDPGVKYKLLSNITNAYMDPRWNRKPHDVIITESPISAEKQYALQLTDIVQGKKMSAMIKRVNAIKSLGDNMKGSLISQILKGVDPAVINKYIEKGKAAGKKEAKRVSRDKLSVAERAPEVKKPTGTRPAEFDLKSNSERKEFVSDYTGITDHVQRRAKRVEKIVSDQRKGKYKNADTRKHEANHAKYIKRGEKLRRSVRR